MHLLHGNGATMILCSLPWVHLYAWCLKIGWHKVIRTKDLWDTTLLHRFMSYTLCVQVLHDSVHKSIRLGPLAVKIMDSPQFQRLRDLKQLGTSYLVFPGASHNRWAYLTKAWNVKSLLYCHLTLNTSCILEHLLILEAQNIVELFKFATFVSFCILTG